ncbi:hypothetical protein P9112_001875 [Eukaryota sp. TZLM1-RC]
MGRSRGDLVVLSLHERSSSILILSIDPCNSSHEHFINSVVARSFVAGGEYKIAQNAKPIVSIEENSHAQYNLSPCLFHMVNFSGTSAVAFLEDYSLIVKETTKRAFSRVFWQKRIVFSIFKAMVKLISDSLSSFGKFSESLVTHHFDFEDAGFEDVKFNLFV